MLVPPNKPLHQFLKLIDWQIKNIAIMLFWFYDYSAPLGSAGIEDTYDQGGLFRRVDFCFGGLRKRVAEFLNIHLDLKPLGLNGNTLNNTLDKSGHREQ